MSNIYELIPRLMGSRGMVFFFDFLRFLNRLGKKEYGSHLEENQRELIFHKPEIEKTDGYIEIQGKLKNLKYGKCDMAYSGCEVLATYNALVALHMDAQNPSDTFRDFGTPSLPEIIREYERDGMVLGGYFGTAPRAIGDYFSRHGYKVSISSREEEFEQISRAFDVLIYTFYNHRGDIRKQIHTICISKKNGCFIAHNVDGNGRVGQPVNSFTEFSQRLRNGNARGIALIGIEK